MGNFFANQSACGQWKCKNKNCQSAGDAKISLQLLLVGKTGAGKSSTGNFLIGKGKNPFSTSGGTTFKTKEVKAEFAQHCCYKIQVVDGPDFTEAEIETAVGRENVLKNMDNSLSLCEGGLDVILLVMQLGDKFTPEMKQTISDLEKIFGKDYLKERVIIVITRGDGFEASMKNDGTPGLTFEKWVNSGDQDEDFKKLVKECGSRIVLFNNFAEKQAKIESQIDELFTFAEELRKKGRYTSEHFARYRSRVEHQKKLGLLEEVIERLTCFSQSQFLEDCPQSQLLEDGPQSHLLKDGPQSLHVKDGSKSQLMKDASQSQLLKDVAGLKTTIKELLSDTHNDERSEKLKPLEDVLLQLDATATKLKSAVDGNDSKYTELQMKTLQDQGNLLKTICGKILL